MPKIFNTQTCHVLMPVTPEALNKAQVFIISVLIGYRKTSTVHRVTTDLTLPWTAQADKAVS